MAAAAKNPSSVGPPMSVCIVFGVYQETHGRRTNVVGESTRPFIALRICCWRFARVRSSSAGLQLFLRVRASASACLPFRWFVPECRSSVMPPLRVPPLISEQMRPVFTSTPPSASTSFGKFVKSTSTRWLIGMPRYCSIV